MNEIVSRLFDAGLSGNEVGLIRSALHYRAEHGYCPQDAAEFAILYRKLGGEQPVDRLIPMERAQ